MSVPCEDVCNHQPKTAGLVNASHIQQHMSYSNFCSFFILRADIFLSFSSSFSIRLVLSPLAGSHPASLRRLFSPFPSSAYSSAGFVVLYFTHLHKPSRNITYSTAKRHKCTNVHENGINSIRCWALHCLCRCHRRCRLSSQRHGICIVAIVFAFC